MNDFEKAIRLLALVDAFPSAEASIEHLWTNLSVTEAERMRMASGLTTEWRFAPVFASLPWVKLIHGMDQRQHPIDSKNEFQVPDSFAIVQPKQICPKESPLLIDSKSVAPKKKTANISSQQMKALQRYADTAGIPLLIAVFWRELAMWTMHLPDQFDVRPSGELFLNHDDALHRDVSAIFSDVLLAIESGWYRRTTYDSGATGFHLRDENLGYIVEDAIRTSQGEFVELTEVESGILNVIYRGNVAHRERSGNKTVVERKSTTAVVTKVSSIINFLMENMDVYNDADAPALAFATAESFRQKLAVSHSSNLPKEMTAETNRLYHHVFGIQVEEEPKPDRD